MYSSNFCSINAFNSQMQFSGLHAAGYIKIYTYNILDYVHLKELQLKDLLYYK